MDDTTHLERRARRRYEQARLRQAVVGFAPALGVVAIAAIFASRPSSTLALGTAMFGTGTTLLWYGRDLRRAVLPGLLAGLVPLVLALCVTHLDHVCMGDRCMSLCVPACAVGGLVAGLGVAIAGARRGGRASFFVAASAVALLTGAMGCACVGYGGVLGLALGFGAGLVPGAVRYLANRRASR